MPELHYLHWHSHACMLGAVSRCTSAPRLALYVRVRVRVKVYEVTLVYKQHVIVIAYVYISESIISMIISYLQNMRQPICIISGPTRDRIQEKRERGRGEREGRGSTDREGECSGRRRKE